MIVKKQWFIDSISDGMYLVFFVQFGYFWKFCNYGPYGGGCDGGGDGGGGEGGGGLKA